MTALRVPVSPLAHHPCTPALRMAQLTQYELDRERRIAENKAKLAEFDLVGLAEAVVAGKEQSAPKAQKKPRKRAKARAAPGRWVSG